MVESKTNKMHLEITNDVELDVEGNSTSKSTRKSKKVSAKLLRLLGIWP